MAKAPTRIEVLKRRLAARKGSKEYAKNCEALEAEIKRLELGELDL